MLVEQEQFKENVESLTKQIARFDQYEVLDDHEEVAKVVSQVNKNLKNYSDASKQFNQREQLFGLSEITDYQ